MTAAFMATGDALAVLRRRNGSWRADLHLSGLPTQCLAVDPLRPESAYCGTFGDGIFVSEDAGASWRQVAAEIPYAEVTALAVSSLERSGDGGVIWAGTEPSALFRSEDGGRSWQERSTLREIPSAPTWRFPPRPWTSHVRWIELDRHVPDRLFVGIELGGVMRSLDGGVSWEDRKPGSQYDAHTLRTHPAAPNRVYEAAGGGYAESRDGGESWRGHDDGLTRRYVWGLAVDPANPDVVVVSAAPGPRQAHGPDTAEAAIYRRVGGQAWQEVWDGLPAPKGTRAYVLASSEGEPGVIYAASRAGDLYRSSDGGIHWETEDVVWPDAYTAPDVRSLAIVDGP